MRGTDSERTARESRRANSVTDEAIDKIRELIVTGQWGPGDRLPPEAELAARLGLSRNSLREAVRALSLVRVLEVRQGDGTYVSSLEADLLLESTRFATHLMRNNIVLELYAVRRMLEPGAAALAAARIDDEGLAALSRELDRMVAAETVEDLVDADLEFHAVIARAAGNSVLSSLLESLSTRTLRTRIWRGRDEAGALEVTRAEHRRIYDALRRRDPELARATAAVHVASGEAWLAAHLEAGADWPEVQAVPLPEPR
jgi:GntR family transcriptional regulator, transcriptional repressor for pyruvate dehydrogenase complex